MNTKMKALVKKFPKEGLWLEEVDMPVIGDKDVLVKNEKDCNLWYRCAYL